MQESSPSTSANSQLKERVPLSVARVAGNSLWSLGGWIGAFVLSFVSSPILIRLLGQDHYGLMALLTTIVTPMGLLDFGVGEATVKYVAESLGKRDLHQVEKFIRSTLMFNLIVGLLGGVVILLLSGFLTTSVFKIPLESQNLARHCLYWIGLTWCVTQARQTFIGTITALQRYEILNAGTLLSQVLTITAGLGTLFLGGNLLDLVRAQAIVAVLVGIGWMIGARKLSPGMSFAPRIDRGAFRRTFGFGFWQMLSNVGAILAHQSQRWLLGVLLPLATVGFYNVSIQLVTVVYSLTYRVGQVLFPAVSQMQGEAREEQAARLAIQANWALSTLSISGFIPLMVFAHDILYLWIGPDFAIHSSKVLRIVCIGMAMACLFAIHNFFLLGTGRAKLLAAMSFAQGLITLTVSAFLIPRLGVVGAGWGLSSGTIVHAVVLIGMWKRLYRNWVPSRVYLSATFGQFVVGGFLAAGLMLARDSYVWLPNWVLLGIAGMVCSVFSGAVMVIADSVLPGGKERHRLVLRLCSTLIPSPWRLKKWLNSVT